MSITGRVTVITGVSSGVGRGVAAEFARQGALVVGMARREDLGKALEREVRDLGGELTFVAGDVRSTDDCDRLVRTAVDLYGGLDILINNAGIEGELKPFHLLSDADWESVLDVNLTGVFRCTRAAIPRLLERGRGTVINIASVNGAPGLASAYFAAYNTSKAGLVQLTRTLAVEYLQHKIRFNVVYLGSVEGETNTRSQEKIAKLVRGADYERVGTGSEMEEALRQSPTDVGKALALLCDDEAALINGSTIAIDQAATAGFISSSMVLMSCADLLPS